MTISRGVFCHKLCVLHCCPICQIGKGTKAHGMLGTGGAFVRNLIYRVEDESSSYQLFDHHVHEERES